MASYKYHLRPSAKKEVTEGKLFIRVIHLRRYKDISTPFSLRECEWDKEKGRIIYHDEDTARNKFLAEVENSIGNSVSTLEIIEKDLSRNMVDYSAADIVDTYKTIQCKTSGLFSFCEKVSSKLMATGQARTARAYRSATRSLLNFKLESNLSLEDIDNALMRDYESYLKARKLEKNTISFYIRNIRALYRRGIAEKLIRAKDENPFMNVYTGVYNSPKRALNLTEIRALLNLQERLDRMAAVEELRVRKYALALGDSLKYFNFCFQGRGMSWIDMVYLRKIDLREESFIYRRKKTGRKLEIIITEDMRKIINHFSLRTINSPYVFPVLDPGAGDERSQYETGLRIQNERLKVLAGMAGINKNITTHTARHTKSTFRLKISELQDCLF